MACRPEMEAPWPPPDLGVVSRWNPTGRRTSTRSRCGSHLHTDPRWKSLGLHTVSVWMSHQATTAVPRGTPAAAIRARVAMAASSAMPSLPVSVQP